MVEQAERGNSQAMSVGRILCFQKSQALNSRNVLESHL